MDEKFNDFFNKYKEKLDIYYNNLNDYKRKISTKFLIITIIFTIILLFGFYNLSYIHINILPLLVLSIIALIIVLGFGYYSKLKSEMYNINKDIIKDIISYISKDENSIYEPNKQISEKNINEMKLFNLENLKYTGRNAISTNYNGNNMNFADMEIYYYEDKEIENKTYDNDGNEQIKKTIQKVKKYVFDGCYISATLNKNIAEHIYLIPNKFSEILFNCILGDNIKYTGDEVKLENLEFSKKYKVYSRDEIQARYILSLSLMEKINNIDDILEGKKYIVFKEGRRFVICLEGFKIENIRKCVLPFSKNSKKVIENIKYIFKNIYKLFMIYDILDLGNDIYVDKN